MYFLVHFASIANTYRLKFSQVLTFTVYRLLLFGSIFLIVLLLSLFFGASVTNLDVKLRIANGQEAIKGDCTSIVFLGCSRNKTLTLNGSLDLADYCGAGSIINENWILTAAHLCFDVGRGIPSFVVAGVHHVHEPEEHWQWRTIFKAYRHPQILLSDLCLLRLAEPLNLTSSHFIQPAKLLGSTSANRKIPVGTELITFGWGRLYYEPSAYSSVLRKVSQRTVSIDNCQQRFSKVNGILINGSTMVCALGPDKGPCNGDSGAPLMWTRKSFGLGGVQVSSEQVGVVSWGVECAHEYYPNVYASVQNSIEWIRNYTGYLY